MVEFEALDIDGVEYFEGVNLDSQTFYDKLVNDSEILELARNCALEFVETKDINNYPFILFTFYLLLC